MLPEVWHDISGDLISDPWGSAQGEGKGCAETQWLGTRWAQVSPSLLRQQDWEHQDPTSMRADADQRWSPCISHRYL